MSLNTIMSTATTGLLTAQIGLRTVSDNIANANTPGYVRKIVDQVSLSAQGMGVGVDAAAVRRVTDSYLQTASLNASSSAGRSGAIAEFLDTAQGLFGDPTGDASFFTRYDDALSAFSAAAEDPASSILRSQALARMQDYLSDANRITSSLGDLEKQADTRISADVDRVNDLLQQIDHLNADIVRAKSVGADSTGSENIQNQLVNELSTLMNVQVGQKPTGSLILRSTEGIVLAGEGPATLTYQRSDTAAGYFTLTPANGVTQPQPASIISGELKGLLELRDKELPRISDQLGELVTRAVQEFNRAHNASSSVPAPASLTGNNIGIDLPTAVTGFSGKTTIALTDASGVIQHQVAIDFTAGTMALDGGAAAAFTPANFQTTLNTTLGAFGTVAYTNNTMSITANGGLGVSVVDDATTPSTKAGRGFSQFFGLNDLIRSSGLPSYDTGLTTSDAHGFTPGDTMKLRITDANGGRLRDVTITVPAAGTMQSLLTAMNDVNTGVGLYGTFSLDANGAMSYAPLNSNGSSLSVLSDATKRGAGGPSISELFGIGPGERSNRAARYNVDSNIMSNPSRLALAQVNLSAAPPVAALLLGDGRGGLALAQAGDRATGFAAAGDFSAVSMTVSRYASEFGGLIGRKAASADSSKTSAESVQTEADARRQSVEGVNLDEELVKLTTYQQAFNASARIITATKDMYDTLMSMMR
ncbi:MAG: flagellar hook-associated protein FlgK [Caulobacteraceae bacterium]